MKQILFTLLAAALLAGMILIGESSVLENTVSEEIPSSSETSSVPVSSESSSEPVSDVPVSVPVSSEPVSSESSSEPISSSSEPEEPEVPKPDPYAEWNLILINADNLLPEDYTFELTPINEYFSFDSRAVEALNEFLAAGRAAGHDLQIVSTYRTTERSAYLYERKINQYIAAGYSAEDAAVEAARWVAPPRQSEHNAALAIDVVSSDYYMYYSDLMHEFDEFPAFTWLTENCAEYGFIMRYPEDKQDITGITYEPWHYRYVGVEHAMEMKRLDLCFEEYWEYLLS